jgi:hypothetical protein
MKDKPDLTDLVSQVQHSENNLPPIDKWNPPFSGDLDMRIKRDGRWYYLGSEIKRKALVKLFASILLKEDDHYFLVTPVEKFRIQVDDAPFIAISVEKQVVDGAECLSFLTNVDESVTADAKHPIRVQIDPLTGEPSPYILVRRNLEALISRNLFYQLVDQAEVASAASNELFVFSAGERFSLGRF